MAATSGDVQVSFPRQVPLTHSKDLAATTPDEDDDPTSLFINRAASFSSISDDITKGLDSADLKTSFSDLNLSSKAEPTPVSKDTFATGKDILRRVSMRVSNGKAKIAISRFTLSTEDLQNVAAVPEADVQALDKPAKQDNPSSIESASNKCSQGLELQSSSSTAAEAPTQRPSKARSVSGKIATLARRSWIGPSTASSRSPSPAPTDSKSRSSSRNRQESKSRFSRSRESSPRRSSLTATNTPQSGGRLTNDETTQDGPVRRTSRPRPMSAFISRRKSTDLSSPDGTSTPSLRSKSSMEKLGVTNLRSAPVMPPLPKIATSWASAELGRKKDELWGVFRALEADYQKFQSKSSALKVNLIRSTLLPFLSRSATPASMGSLRPEDLDRRVNILNKWWTGLLEILNGRNHQPITGVDRPVYLEAVARLMMRPEWRVPFPSAQTNPSALLQNSAAASASHSSLDSAGSDFLIESIHHNIRNIFIQNLLSQMAYVVERMSMRHAPASLVAFCGKACAYAFCFCPGVADMLVRLWSTPSDVHRRVMAEAAVGKGLRRQSAPPELLLGFPPAIRNLAFSSHAALARYLRQPPNVPLSAAKIPWHGPWLSRWSGRDTDLFFVFVKHFHILLAEFLPPYTDRAQTVLAPGVLAVHGQLLVVLEDTIYKQSGSQFEEVPQVAASITFDDFMEGADTSVAALPLGAANSQRSMAENRLVTLLKDFLSETSRESSRCRRLFAASFHSMMKAAAQKTSLFDHNACFVLCDFVEEVITILLRYSQSIQAEIFDWSFWLQVCKLMMHSENSLTEVRVFAFIFGVWDVWTSEKQRKKNLCTDFLLSEEIFYHYFSHWSPMVRAYFHRLLCWRVARCPDDLSSVDLLVYETLLDRLEQTYAYYIFAQNKAGKELKAPLSSAPCSPAPGRRIIILRSESQPSPGLLSSFDRMMAPSSSDHMSAYRSHGRLRIDLDGLPPDMEPPQKRRWNILKNVFSSPANPKPGEVTPPGSSSDDTEATATNGYFRSHGSDNSLPSQVDSASHDGDDQLRPATPHQPFSFRFSLEWLDRPQWPSKNKRLYPPRVPSSTESHVQRYRALEMPYRDSDGSLSADADGRDADTSTVGQSSKRSYETDKTSVDSGSVASIGPRNERVVASKYAGRALAEWAHVVSECDSFFERRRDEGVPSDRQVETPILTVDSFRK